ncbi:unnamed protein product [Prorocentrum cordatum]|uniref:Uncharacterized protein n=1 Tax=Prorocentrum cordatum TaxID=2364126 RepID=A0ABN9TY17_9DINO|nr:unnamed protein product [Polarella glacialis]
MLGLLEKVASMDSEPSQNMSEHLGALPFSSRKGVSPAAAAIDSTGTTRKCCARCRGRLQRRLEWNRCGRGVHLAGLLLVSSGKVMMMDAFVCRPFCGVFIFGLLASTPAARAGAPVRSSRKGSTASTAALPAGSRTSAASGRQAAIVVLPPAWRERDRES